jgi:hypothetical protein
MQLITVHKILISAGILFFLFFGIRELVIARSMENYLRVGFSVLAVTALGIYLRWVIRTNKT